MKGLKITHEIERIEQQGLSSEIAKKLSRKTKANTYSGFLLSCMKKLRDNGNLDAALLTETYYNKFKKDFAPRKLHTIELVNWKGKDKINIYKDFQEDFIIIEHRKDKTTGEVENINHTIPKENVNFLKNIINKLKIGESMKYKETIGIIIESKRLSCDRDSFNGGRNRSQYYFPFYYFPAKILEALSLIKYSGRGQITRLK
jgi:hypothetical protein